MIIKYTWQFFIFSNICSYCQKIKITINLILSLEEAATISYKGLLLSFYTTQYLTNRLDYPNTQTGTGSGSHTNFLRFSIPSEIFDQSFVKECHPLINKMCSILLVVICRKVHGNYSHTQATPILCRLDTFYSSKLLHINISTWEKHIWDVNISVEYLTFS